MRYLLQTGILLLMALAVAAPVANAAADWEWSRDKGWTQGAGKAKDTPGAQLRSAYELEKSGRYMNASQEYFLLLKTYPDSQEAGLALQRLAACLFQMEDYYDAFNALQQVIKSYSMSAKKSDLIKIEFLIGRKFQEGARKDLLNDKEPVAVGKQTAVEIFKAVIDNDPVGPYAGAATLAVAACYKDLGSAQEGIVYADRVINEFGQSVELVAKARILKKQMEVMLGKASVPEVKSEIENATKLLEEARESSTSGQGDFAATTDFDEEIRELEEAQAEKLWIAADFYKRRGSRESISAYKFSLEQLIIRFPNTTYADRARRVVGKVKIPPPENPFGKINIPFMNEKKEATFAVAGNSASHVESVPVHVPGTPGAEDMPESGGSSASVNPVAPPRRNMTAAMEPAAVQPIAQSPSVANNGTPEIPDENMGVAPQKEAISKQVDSPRAVRQTPPQDSSRKPVARRSTPPGSSSSAATPGALRPNIRKASVASQPVAPAGRFAPSSEPSIAPISASEESDDRVIVRKSTVVTRPAVRSSDNGGVAYAPSRQTSSSSAVPAAIRPASARPVRQPITPPAETRPVRQPDPLPPVPSSAVRSTPPLPGEEEPAGYSSTPVSDGPVVAPDESAGAPQLPPVTPVTRSNMELPPLPEGTTEEVTVIREAASTAASKANEASAGGNNWEFSEDFK